MPDEVNLPSDLEDALNRILARGGDENVVVVKNDLVIGIHSYQKGMKPFRFKKNWANIAIRIRLENEDEGDEPSAVIRVDAVGGFHESANGVSELAITLRNIAHALDEAVTPSPETVISHRTEIIADYPEDGMATD